ncbi:hypothetical protein SDC9_175232 [bioreactor metagenome]|uniref:Uncharacterized protein n=1 Tax=bioreactor metagenome TaxID=1076179 RepID=A0A645GLJ7_9ZZZZ
MQRGPGSLTPAEGLQYRQQNPLGRRRAAGYEQIHRHCVLDPFTEDVTLCEYATGYGACPHGHHCLGGRGGVEGLQRSPAHIVGHGARNEEHVRMPGRCDYLDAEPPHIVVRVGHAVHLHLAGIAGARIQLPYRH